ncbi:carboxypeptidase M-like [Ornithodoros turicata]|uniref:carboxypeptidase M-like n=1 Tax=Ornithodoros turicata TaxID=34597 RepID=UPI0031390063
MYLLLATHLALNTIVFADLLFDYHPITEVNSFVADIARKHSNVAKLQTLGQTWKGHPIWVVSLSLKSKEDNYTPNVYVIANIHGNNVVTREVALHLISYMAQNQRSDPDVEWLLNNARVHVVPAVNIDGSDASIPGDCMGLVGSENTNGINLNQNFPEVFDRTTTKTYEPETASIMRLERAFPGVIALYLFGGFLAVMYPYDDVPGFLTHSPQGSPTPDDDVFKHLSTVYASTHNTMHLSEVCPGKSYKLKRGIINGANFSKVSGSVADYSYAYEGVMGLNVYIGCCKYDSASTIQKYFEDNKTPILKTLREVGRGVRGTIMNRKSHRLAGVLLCIHNRTSGFRTNANGEFWRILLPGFYTLLISAEGYLPTSVDFQVQKKEVTTLEVKLYTGYFYEE